MTRKDFEKLAEKLRQNKPQGGSLEGEQQWERDVLAVADVLADTNPRFDRARFRKAAGIN